MSEVKARNSRGEPLGLVEDLSGQVTRRDALRAAGGAGASSCSAACSPPAGDASDSTTPTTVDLGKLDVQARHRIPQATVRYGSLPYGDNSMPVIGMQKGWFDEVGITVQPSPSAPRFRTTRSSRSSSTTRST